MELYIPSSILIALGILICQGIFNIYWLSKESLVLIATSDLIMLIIMLMFIMKVSVVN